MSVTEDHKQKRTAYLAGIASDADSPQARAAFAKLVTLWHADWSRFAYSRVPDLAEDVLQDSVITMARGIPRLRDPATFKAWSMTILHRRSVDAIRAAIRRREAEGAVDPPKSSPPQDWRIDLEDALSALPETDRTLIRLHYREGHTIRVLSEQLGVPAGTIKSRLFTARQTLKTHLKGDDNE